MSVHETALAGRDATTDHDGEAMPFPVVRSIANPVSLFALSVHDKTKSAGNKGRTNPTKERTARTQRKNQT